jgi:hypothetical protein
VILPVALLLAGEYLVRSNLRLCRFSSNVGRSLLQIVIRLGPARFARLFGVAQIPFQSFIEQLRFFVKDFSMVFQFSVTALLCVALWWFS